MMMEVLFRKLGCCSEKEIKIKLDPLRTVNILMRKGMGHTAVSAT